MSKHDNRYDQPQSTRRQFLFRATRDIVAVAAFSGLFTLPGCGGGRSATHRAAGAIELAIKWPTAPTRFIPLAANSVVITVTEAGSDVVVAKLSVTRPKESVIVVDVPAGEATVTAKAYASPDGAGTVLATGTTPTITVEAGKTTAVQTLTLGTTINAVTVSSAVSSVKTGASVLLTAVARDADGNTVLVAPGIWQWQSGDTTIATVAGSGVDNTASVTGRAAGSVAIVATDAEDSAARRSGECRLTVTTGGALRVGWVDVSDSDNVFHTADLDGANVLTTVIPTHFCCNWTSDGQRLTWQSNDGCWNIGALGAGNAALTFADTVNYVQLSGDGSRAVWLDTSEDLSRVQTAPLTWSVSSATLGEITTLSAATLTADTPNISDDGSKIAYLGQVAGETTWRIFTVNPDGTAVVDVSSADAYAASQDYRPTLSADGSQVAWELAEAASIACAPSSGGNPSTWRGRQNWFADLRFVGGASQICWNGSNGATQGNGNVYRSDADGANQITLTTAAGPWVYGTDDWSYSYYLPSFSADGAYMAYTENAAAAPYRAGIRVLETATGRATTITTDSRHCNPVIFEP